MEVLTPGSQFLINQRARNAQRNAPCCSGCPGKNDWYAFRRLHTAQVGIKRNQRNLNVPVDHIFPSGVQRSPVPVANANLIEFQVAYSHCFTLVTAIKPYSNQSTCAADDSHTGSVTYNHVRTRAGMYPLTMLSLALALLPPT